MWARLGFQRGFDRDMKLLLGEMFSRRIVMGFLEVVRVIYFSMIGLSPVATGFLITLGTIVSALESLFFGSLSDRYGRKPFLLIGSIFSVFRLVLYALSRDFWILAIAQGIGALGEGAGAGQPVVSGYISDKTKREDRSHIFSILAITNALSATIGSLMAILPAYFQLSPDLDEASSHIPLFWIGVAVNALAVIILLPIKEARERMRENDEGLRLSDVSWKDLCKYCIIRSTDGLGMGLVSPLLPLYFHLRFGAGSETLAPIYALGRFLPIFLYFSVPLFVDRFGNVRCLVITRIVTGAVIAVFVLSPDFQMATVLFVTYRLLFEFAMPMRQSFATEIVEPSQIGALVGVSNFTRSFIQSLAPTIAGYLYEFVSLSIPFFSGAIILAVNGVQYHVFYRKKAGTTKQFFNTA